MQIINPTKLAIASLKYCLNLWASWSASRAFQ